MNSLLFWFLLLFAFYAMYAMGARSAAGMATTKALQPPPVIPKERLVACEAKLAPLMAISGHRVLGQTLQFEGTLGGRVDEVFQKIREAFAGDPVSPMLLEDEANQARVLHRRS